MSCDQVRAASLTTPLQFPSERLHDGRSSSVKAGRVQRQGEAAGSSPIKHHCRQRFVRRVSATLTPVAVADAVRTSLGPKGMDKMVEHLSLALNDAIRVDSDWQRTSRHLQRRCHDLEAHVGHAPGRQDGRERLVHCILTFSWLTCRLRRMSRLGTELRQS